MKPLFIALLLSVFAFGQAPSKEEDIRQLIKLTGGAALGKQMAQMMVQQSLFQIRANPKMAAIPEKEWAELTAAVTEAVEEVVDLGMLLEKMIPIYDRNFSADDVKELVRFYSSPAGQRVLRVMPQVMQESVQVGTQWGKEIGPAIEKKVKEKLAGKGHVL